MGRPLTSARDARVVRAVTLPGWQDRPWTRKQEARIGGGLRRWRHRSANGRYGILRTDMFDTHERPSAHDTQPWQRPGSCACPTVFANGGSRSSSLSGRGVRYRPFERAVQGRREPGSECAWACNSDRSHPIGNTFPGRDEERGVCRQVHDYRDRCAGCPGPVLGSDGEAGAERVVSTSTRVASREGLRP